MNIRNFLVLFALALQADAENLLQNGSFEAPLGFPWTISGPASMRTVETDAADGTRVLEVVVPEKPAQWWDAVLIHNGLAFREGIVYRLSVHLRSDTPTTVNLGISDSDPPWRNYGSKMVAVSSRWREHRLTVGPFPDDVEAADVIVHVGFDAGTLWVDDARLEATGAAPDIPFGYSGERRNGMSYPSWIAGEYASPLSDRVLEDIAATGTDWIAVVPTVFQDGIAATAITTTDRTATDADLAHVIDRAHALGLNVLLKPHLDLLGSSDPRSSIGRTFATDAEWSAWFAAYRPVITHYAALAEAHGIKLFCIGTELDGTTDQEAEWRDTIQEVRSRYTGSIVYDANHSGAEFDVGWWDAVDYIGVSGYYPLTDTNDPTVEELKRAWEPRVKSLGYLSALWQRPVLFTEVGYRSMDGANRSPGIATSKGDVDLLEQADCYRAFFESVYDQSWFAGMFVWNWDPNPYLGGCCDAQYTPSDKPAEDVLRAWYGRALRETIACDDDALLQPDESNALDIYTDALQPGWQDWSWGDRDMAATEHVHTGEYAIRATLDGWEGIRFHHPDVDPTAYEWLEFYLRRSIEKRLPVWCFFFDEDGAELRRCELDNLASITPAEHGWESVRIRLRDAIPGGAAARSFAVQNSTGDPTPQFWIDDIRFVPAAKPR